VARADFKDGMGLLRRRLSGRTHLVLDTELYSLRDLEQVAQGKLKVSAAAGALPGWRRGCSS